MPITGEFTLDAAEGSSFRLTLDGFSSSRSSCEPICGDGVVSAGEDCDDGENDGGWGMRAGLCRRRLLW